MYKQICIYAFSKNHLDEYYNYGIKNGKTPAESYEDIEIIRFLELGLDVTCSDYNPLAHLIEKTILEFRIESIPSVFATFGILIALFYSTKLIAICHLINSTTLKAP